MINRDNHVPEAPANWDQYSSALGNLPTRPLPIGADGRLGARLAAATATPRASRPWLAGAMAIAAGTVAVVAGLSIFSSGNPQVSRIQSPQTTEAAHQIRKPRNHRPRPRTVAPRITSTPSVDTMPPTSIQHFERPTEVTTGGDRSTPRGGVVPGLPPHQHQTSP